MGNWNSCRCRWACKLVRPTRKAVWQCRLILNMLTPSDPAVQTLGIYSTELHPRVCSRKVRSRTCALAAVVMTTLRERPVPSGLAFVRFIKVLFWLLFADSLVLFLSWFRTSTRKRVTFNKIPSWGPGTF